MIINTNSIRLDGHVLFYDVVLSSLLSQIRSANIFADLGDSDWAMQTHEIFVDHDMLETIGTPQVWVHSTPQIQSTEVVFIAPVLGELMPSELKTIINLFHIQSRAVAKPREEAGIFPFARTMAMAK